MTINDSGIEKPQRSAWPKATREPNAQDPIAIVGMACRLPGENHSPTQLWKFLERGGVASNSVPKNRFNISGHYDGSMKPGTMRPPGGMFLENIDLADFDASFFGISTAEATSMDPNQRQLLEVVYEALENSGITLEQISGAPVGCFIGSYAADYHDMQSRDPEDRPASIEIGIGRAILSNRISHFLNIKGPSVTVDTACSGSLVGIDLACRYLQSGETNCAIIAASNLYLSPEHVMDTGPIRMAHSPSGFCHTFDIKADGYIKAEAVSSVILKRLDDAIRDGDPIRAVIRGSTTNSDGRTPGIASPSPVAQAAAIRTAYSNAGIKDLSLTGYLECHGTGTQAGDPLEVKGVSSVFSNFRTTDSPLVIGSVKSNLGHSESAAGLSGLLKVVLALEHGTIPGNPTFETPNPNIDFHQLRVRATRKAIAWPDTPFRRASVNSFGYGGTNSHLIVDELAAFGDIEAPSHVSSYVSGDEDDLLEGEEDSRPHIIVLSANSEQSLQSYCDALDQHLSNLEVKVDLANLAYTLSERRSQHFHRAYAVVRSTDGLEANAFTFGKPASEPPRIGFIFTGQGAQWPQMGKELVETFPIARQVLNQLDAALQELPTPPSWSLLDELVEARSAEHLRQPEFSQPLVTALQIVILSILESWEIEPSAVVGHSSGEIAAAYATGYLTKEEAIKVAFYRGYSAKHSKSMANTHVGMMAVGLGAEAATTYLEGVEDQVHIACFNSPKSVTLSGAVPVLQTVKERIVEDGHFARLLQVDLAYHSKFMNEIGEDYEQLLQQNFQPLETKTQSKPAVMFSSVTGSAMETATTASYWKANMTSPVRFDDAVQKMISAKESPNFLIEIGPSGALAGPISQIKEALGAKAANVRYTKALTRGTDSVLSLFGVAGRLFVEGASISLAKVNQEPGRPKPLVIVDLPNYAWNHTAKYWHENDSSRDWRFRPYPHHDLLGTKVLGSPWHAPSFRKTLRLEQLPWLRDHKMGPDILMPASGYIAMAIEAMYQTSQALQPVDGVVSASQLCYRLRNVTFDKALVLEDNVEAKLMLTLTPHPGTNSPWYDFKVSSSRDDVWLTHCVGLIRLSDADVNEPGSVEDTAPLRFPTPAHMWYKAQANIGYGFGPAFQKLIDVESLVGNRRSRATVSLEEPEAAHTPQSHYPLHPAVLDGCFQTTQPALRAGDRSSLDSVVVPASIDELIINAVDSRPAVGVSLGYAGYTGRGRREEAKNYWSSCTVYDPETRHLLLRLSGLRCHKLDTGVELHSEHTLSQTVWRPDVSYLSGDQIISLARESQPRIQDIIDLIAHKSPRLRVLEVNLAAGDGSSLWFDGGHRSLRAAYSSYTLASPDAKAVVNARSNYEKHGRTSFELHDFSKAPLNAIELKYGLVLIKVSSVGEDLASLANHARSILADGAVALFVEDEAAPYSDSEDSDLVVVPDEVSEASETCSLVANGFENIATVSIDGGKRVHIATASYETTPANRHISVIHLVPGSRLSSGLKATLRLSGWKVTEHSAPFANLERDSILLILDDLVSPVLPTIEEAQWGSLKQLVLQGHRTLWVTEGSQMSVTKPNNALAHGLFRTIRAEDRGCSVTTLDVEYGESPSAFYAVRRVLSQLSRPVSSETPVESEFVERGGIIYINRVVPDELVNQFKKAGSLGGEPLTKPLRDIRPVAMLRAERLGTLDALCYSEMSSEPEPVGPGMIEVELYASGLNFKDIAVTMGIVPENEHLLGLEGAGVVQRVGQGAEQFQVGDRVAVLRNGTFANRIQCPIERAHKIPGFLSFEDAATIPLVYLTSIYSLFDIGGLTKGKSVLIHSAAGGIGLSCIQLAQWAGADVYVTVGTDEKRRFLQEDYGIPPERIFSSRDTQFAASIRVITGGRGIDVIINSLTGELLDESWRICADGGVMVEIGKKDIVDRNYLSMEPFDRNCSFRAVDFSYKQVTDSLIQRLLAQTFQLVKDRHVKPIHPITTYGFDEIPEAFAFMRSGKHIGKIVITNGQETPSVPVRPPKRNLSLRADRAYMIVGGLKGLCGSLAVYLAREGAKHIIALSRSGCSDERSQKVIANCNALGCTVHEAAADVSDPNAVRSVFEKAVIPVAGVIQGAMVLRDRPYESMTAQDFHTTIASKVQGTWNLHHAALAQKEPLEFFTLLSSISGVIGQKGQANYSAANVFLDAFARYRHSLGLAAHSVDLGVIEDVGYVAEQGGMKRHFDDKQWTGINESMLHRILFYSILQQTDSINKASAAQMITGIPVPQPPESELAYDARFSLLFGSSEGPSGSQGGNSDEKDIQAFSLLRSSAPDHAVLLAAAVELTGAKFTKALRLGESIEPGKSLATYGLDSLSAVEFRNWVRLALGAEITVLDITNASSLFALCEKILDKLPK